MFLTHFPPDSDKGVAISVLGLKPDRIWALSITWRFDDKGPIWIRGKYIETFVIIIRN